MYVNGLSTSLPPAVQLEFLQSVPGLERVRMTRPGYAIEYDYFPPTQLHPTLESRALPGLFFAGQMNGTTGYEEAAGQGAPRRAQRCGARAGQGDGRAPPDEAFIGVLIDDLVTRGVDEPYRLFTSRSEFRLLLRQDNALRRLLPLVERLGLLSDDERSTAESRLRSEQVVRDMLEEMTIAPGEAAGLLSDAESPQLTGPARMRDLARRQGLSVHDLLAAKGVEVERDCCEWAEIELKYAGYIDRERDAAVRLSQMEDFILPATLNYSSLLTVSFEAREKLQLARPASLGQASRIPGVSPSDLQSLVMEVLKRRQTAV